MNIELQQLFGIWRHTHGDIIIDFNLRQVDNDINSQQFNTV